MSGFLGFAENLPVAIIGGPSAGKSTFLAGALVELDAPDTGVYIEPLSESRDAYSRLVEAMRTGVPPEKTVDEQRPALVAEVQGTGRSRALYAYDLAGEVYSAEDKVRGLRFLARSAGIVLLVDPFSIGQVAEDHAQQLHLESAKVLPSSEDPMRVYERLLSTLKEAGADTKEMPLAVVIAKSDALGVQAEIDQLASASGGGERAWLSANGAGNLVRSIEQDFKQVGWFSLSALGRMPDPANKSPFTPRGALAPLLWILAKRNIHPSPQAATSHHTAEQLTGTAADFPPPSPKARTRNASIVTVLASLALIASLIAIIAVSSTPNNNIAYATNENAANTGSGSRADETSSTESTPITTSTKEKTAHPHARSAARGPSLTIRRHLEDLNNANYNSAFSLMSASYRSQNPNWESGRSAAAPMVNIVEIGTPTYGGGDARVYVKFYARDRNPSEGSDTQCRRFEGVVQLVPERGAWRYEPKGNSLAAVVEPPGDSNCRP
jgi:hypothetical protein